MPESVGPDEEKFRMKVLLAARVTIGLLLGLGLAGVLVLAPARAQAQMESREAIALQNQIAELRAEVQGLRDQIARSQGSGGTSLGGYQAPAGGDAGSSDMTAQLLGRVQRMEDELRSLRGRVDEEDNARQRQAEDFNKQLGDLKFEVENGAGGAAGAGAPPGTPPGTPPGQRPTALSPPPGNLAAQVPGAGAGPGDVPPPPPPPPPKRTPELILQEGNAALARKDYPAAEAAAKSVLALGGPKAVDAQYLLARAAYGKRDFSSAAVAYDDTYNRSRTGSHAQDALLGLAASLDAIAEKRAACQTLDKLAAEFPTLRPDLRVPVATLRRDAGCH
jgi:TolA-binding protein